MVRDRTTEFRSALDSFAGGGQLFPPSPKSSVLSSSKFSTFATAISREISSTNTRLEQLTKVARNKSIFDDNSQEFESKSATIRKDLSKINRAIQELKKDNEATTQVTNPQLQLKTAQEHRRMVALILQTWAAQSLKSFENVLEIRTQALKSKKDRRDQFGSAAGSEFSSLVPSDEGALMAGARSPSNSASSSPSKTSSTAAARSTSKQRPVDPSIFSFAPVVHIDQGNDPAAIQSSSKYKKFDDGHAISIDFSSTDHHQQQTQSLQFMESEPLLDSRTLRARNNALGTIESTINELGSIYQQLAHMVSEQGNLVQRIDMNIEDVSFNVERGQTQLARYLRRVSSNRWLLIKIFLALILFIIFFKFLFF